MTMLMALSFSLLFTSCGGDDEDSIPADPSQGQTSGIVTPEAPTTINYFAQYGNLLTVSSSICSADEPWGSPVAVKERYRYNFDDLHRVTQVYDLYTSQSDLFIYEADKITLLEDSGREHTFEYRLEDGRITECYCDGVLDNTWEYDDDDYIISNHSYGDEGSRIHRVTWIDGDIVEVRIDDADGRDSGMIGAMWTYEPSDVPVTNPFAIFTTHTEGATTCLFEIGLNRVLLAEGYYGRSVPRHYPAKETPYFPGLDTTSDIGYSVSSPTEYRYTCDERGRVVEVRTKSMLHSLISGYYYSNYVYLFSWE